MGKGVTEKGEYETRTAEEVRVGGAKKATAGVEGNQTILQNEKTSVRAVVLLSALWPRRS